MPGLLGGFTQPADSTAFDRLFQQAITDYGDSPFWCCMSWGDADKGPMRKMYYQLPAPLAGAPGLRGPEGGRCSAAWEAWGEGIGNWWGLEVSPMGTFKYPVLCQPCVEA